MTTEQTAQQLELAAQILRTGHPWEYRHIAGSHHKYNTPIEVVADGNTLSPLLATPPDNRPLHNPDNLTAEQVGVGYRLLLPVELDGRHKKACEVWDGKNDWSGEHLAFARYKFLSYRLPLSVPWPEPEKPDPYAELKAAHAAGRVVQVIDCGSWLDLPTPNWCEPVGRYRIKPTESAKPEPADPYAELKAAHAAGKVIQGLIGGYWIGSPHPTWKYPVDTYRVKPDEPQTVPQSSTFFLPGTVIRFPDATDLWGAITAINRDGLVVGDTYQSYQELATSKAMANRSLSKGQWNPDAWEPCSKTIPA